MKPGRSASSDLAAVPAEKTLRPAENHLWTVPFLLLIASSMLGYANIYLLVPIFPGYFDRLGGSHADLGLAAALFNATALVTRPGCGWLVDRLGGRVVMLLGLAGLGASCLGYFAASYVGPALLVRGLHGIGWGLFTVAGATAASEMAAPHQRGQALGVYGMSGGLALALGPVIGAAVGSEAAAFLVAAAAGGVAIMMVLLLPGPMAQTRHKGGARFTLVSRRALLPASMLLIYFGTYGAVFAFIPVLTDQRHLGGPGWFFTPYAAALFLYRTISGGLSDRFGRAQIIAPGMLVSAAALALLAVSFDRVALAGSAILYAGGMATIQPASLAWAGDRTEPAQRGAALATAIAAQDLGISTGAFVAGEISDAAGLRTVFLAFAGVAGLGLLFAGALARTSQNMGTYKDELRRLRP